jgi:hypothetical protein
MKGFLYLILMFFSVHGFSSNLNFSKSISQNKKTVLNDSLYVEEKNKKISNDSIVYPDFITREYKFLSEDLIIQNTNNLDRLYKVSQSNIKSSGDPFEGLNTAGSISRGINLGNNRNSVLNSELDLQIYGKLNDKVEITASIQDANIPLQDNGYSQTLDEFDQIFIELKSDKWKIRAGDIDLKNYNTYFGMFSKRIQGLLISAQINDEENAYLSAAIVKGQFKSSNITAQDGNQGPYKMQGGNGELYILVVSDSEKVYVNGMLLQRGENKDYIIDYNAGEIVFNTTYPISSEMRIKVDYQISDRNYSRFMAYAGGEIKTEKLNVNVMVYNESDLKGQPLQQSLTTENIEALTLAGDDTDLMQSSSIISTEYNENRILYKKVIENNIEFYEFSNNPNDELYSIKFSYVGENEGNYSLATTNTISNIYNYTQPISGVKQGDYQPVINLIAPEEIQIAIVSGDYEISKNSKINFELANSNNDKNKFSSIDDKDNNGLAAKIELENFFTSTDKIEIINRLQFKHINKDFRSIENYYNTEFLRDWNLDSTLLNVNNQFNKTQNEASAEILITKKNIGFVNYSYQNLEFVNNFKGTKHNTLFNYNNNKIKINSNNSLLKSNSELIKSEFSRSYNTVRLKNKNKWFDINLDYENNIKRNKNTDSLIVNSHKFTSYGFTAGIGDSTSVFVELGLNQRVNDSVVNNRIQKVNASNNFSINSRIINNSNTKLSVFTNYRILKRANETNSEKFLNSRINYFKKTSDDIIKLNIAYESNSGNLAQQEFTFIEVDPGVGNYRWIDINNNNIQELEEFEIAQFEDEGIYIRVLLPNQKFIKTYQNKFSQSLNINLKKWSKSSLKLRKILSKFQNQSQYLIQKKSVKRNNQFDLNPFKTSANSLLALTMNLRNNLYFNRGKQHYSTTYTFINNRSKNTLSFGYVENELLSHQINVNHKLKNILFSSLISINNRKSESENFESKNYNFNDIKYGPKFTYFIENSNKIDLYYQYSNTENIIGNFETLSQNKFGISSNFSNKNAISINGELNYYKNKFTGNPNSIIGYIMMEGLQPGNNLTWSLNIQKKITKYVDLNLNYFARKTENNSVIHNGNIQLKANF